jgi:hypothetical protein
MEIIDMNADTPSLGNGPFQKNNLRRAVLTMTKVQEIRAFYNQGHVTQGQLARDYGVSVVQIGRIVRGEVWQGVGPAASSKRELDDTAERLLALQESMLKGLGEPEADEQPPSGLSRLAQEAKTLGVEQSVMDKTKAYGAR